MSKKLKKTIQLTDKKAEQLTEKQKLKKKMKIAVIAALAVSVAGIACIFLFPEETAKNPGVAPSKNDNKIQFFLPDRRTDIFNYEPWLDKNRYLTYRHGGEATMITDGDYRAFGDTVVFMADYFDTLMHGDDEKLYTFYEDSYFETNDRWDDITMQKIYDMEMEYISSTDVGTTTEYVYKISYKIMRNDGTFRNDLRSDAVRSQYYTLVDYGNVIKISSVSYESGVK